MHDVGEGRRPTSSICKGFRDLPSSIIIYHRFVQTHKISVS